MNCNTTHYRANSSSVPGDPTSATTIDTLGGNDVITLDDGDNVVIGGVGADRIDTGNGTDIVLGDNGQVLFSGAVGSLVRDEISSLNDASGGADVIDLGDGAKLVIGGVGADTVEALAGNHDVAGDNASFTYSNGNLTSVASTNSVDGAGDTVTLGAGDHRLVLGIGGDTLVAGNGNTLLLADNGVMTLQEDGTVISLTGATTVNDGADDVSLGDGNVDAILGDGLDTLAMGDGDAVLVGDGGTLGYYLSGLLDTATANSGTGDDDVITVGDGDIVALLGEGDDSLTVGSGSLEALGDSGAFEYFTDGVLNTATADSTTGGDDAIRFVDGDVLVMGGVGSDSVDAVLGAHVVFGDNGELVNDTDGALLSATTLDTLGGNDTIDLGNGDNIVIGGVGADSIDTADGSDIVLGDNGQVLFTGTTGNLVRDTITTLDISAGGADTILTADGDKVILGGAEADSITAGEGDHDVFGDNGDIDHTAGIMTSFATTDPVAAGATSGAGDSITLGAGSNRVAGGLGNDSITTDDGMDVILGDLGTITMDAAGLLLDVESTLSLQGGDDVISSGDGRGWIIGGVGSDTITTGDDRDGVLGDNGSFDFLGGVLQQASSSDTSTATTGNDVISTGAGSDFVIASGGDDNVTTGAGDDIVLADGGAVDYVGRDGNAATIDSVQSGSPVFGGEDTVDAGDGTDSVIGGADADYLDGGTGNDYIIGDGGLILYKRGQLEQMQTLDPYTGGGDDFIIGGTGQDILFGGEGNDTFVANFLEDAVIGDYARFTAESKTLIRFGNDLIGTSQLGVYASNDPFLKETASLDDDGGYRPQIISEGTLARLARESASGNGHRVSGMTEEVELAGVRDVEVDPALLGDPFAELMPPAQELAPVALPGTRAGVDLPAPAYPADDSAEVADAASAAALMFGWGMLRRGARKPKPVLKSWDSYQDGRG